jgi:hypothetical protein
MIKSSVKNMVFAEKRQKKEIKNINGRNMKI